MPDFSNPPVAETVLSVQFEPLLNIHTAHMGLFWKEVKDRFPGTEERLELPTVIEQFPELPKFPAGLQFQLQSLESASIPRCWFINTAGTELIQVQKDRFLKNWRKVGEGDEYPRYERVKAGFEEDFNLFRQFAKGENLGELRLNQCEVTYVNHIVAGEGWSEYSEADKVFTSWRQSAFEYPGKATDIGWNARFPIRDEGHSPTGRLHISVQPAVRSEDGRKMFVMNLTARGLLGSDFDFFDLGREYIVRSFKNLTTAKMHKLWGLRN